METEIKQINPEIMQREALRFGALVRVVYDLIDGEETEMKDNARILMASMALLSANLPEESEATNEDLANVIIELFFARSISTNDGHSYVFEPWDGEMTPFERELGDFATFTVHSVIGFHMGYDSIEESKLIYPFRDLILSFAKEGYKQNTLRAKDHYEEMKEFFTTNPDAELLFQAICDVIKDE